MSPENTPTPAGEEIPPAVVPAPVGGPELSEFALELTKIPIEAIDEKFLLPRTSAQLEEFLTYIHIMLLALKGKAELAGKILDFRGKCVDKARRYMKLPAEEMDLLLATLTPEEAAEVRNAMVELAKGPAVEKPPTQNLGGSYITRDVGDEVLPGGSAKAPAT